MAPRRGETVWRWCGYDEGCGDRRRYRILDVERWAQAVGVAGVAELRELHRDRVEEGLRAERRAREPHWTESLAVGSETFVLRAQEAYAGQRREFVLQQIVADKGVAALHALRETGTPYSADLKPEMAT